MELVMGWKGVVSELHKIGIDYQLRTIKEWHYHRHPIPFRRTSQNPKGRLIVFKTDLRKWVNQVTFARDTHD